MDFDGSSFFFQVLHNIDPIRKFAAIRINQHKLIVNQDAVYETTWHPRYEVEGVLEDSVKQPTTLPGAVIKCDERLKSNGVSCNTSVFPCLFNIEQGMLSAIFTFVHSFLFD